jgi:hypothetical protein
MGVQWARRATDDTPDLTIVWIAVCLEKIGALMEKDQDQDPR